MEIIKKLLSNDLKPQSFSWASFFNISEKELLVILKSLPKHLLIEIINKGELFNVMLFCGGTPFHIIIQFCDWEVLKQMLIKRPNFYSFGPKRNSLYHLAMRNKDNAYKFINLIYQKTKYNTKHVNILNAPNSNFITALGQAVIENNFEVFEFLFHRGAKLFWNKDHIYFLSPIHLLCQLPKTKERMKMFELIMTKKEEIKKSNRIEDYCSTRKEMFSDYPKKTDSILTMACKNGDSDYVKMVLELGANPNRINGRGEYPVLIATKNMNEDIAKLLLTYGASYDIDDYGLQLIHVAKSLGLNSLVKFISELQNKHEEAMKKEMGILDPEEANRKSLELITQLMNDFDRFDDIN